MTIFTIGFTRRSAESFFTALSEAGVKRMLDVRLNNTSQLAGFTKKDDLRYFTRAINGIDYVHLPELAPTSEMLDKFKKQGKDWDAYAHVFRELLRSREVEKTLDPQLLDGGCLLCSEPTAEHCHRRIAA